MANLLCPVHISGWGPDSWHVLADFVEDVSPHGYTQLADIRNLPGVIDAGPDLDSLSTYSGLHGLIVKYDRRYDLRQLKKEITEICNRFSH